MHYIWCILHQFIVLPLTLSGYFAISINEHLKRHLHIPIRSSSSPICWLRDINLSYRNNGIVWGPSWVGLAAVDLFCSFGNTDCSNDGFSLVKVCVVVLVSDEAVLFGWSKLESFVVGTESSGLSLDVLNICSFDVDKGAFESLESK